MKPIKILFGCLSLIALAVIGAVVLVGITVFNGPIFRKHVSEGPIQIFRGVESGPGLMVCDPISAGPSELGDFGDGCGLWLQLAAAGRPELDRTPLWQSRQRAAFEMGRTDLRVTIALSAV